MTRRIVTTFVLWALALTAAPVLHAGGPLSVFNVSGQPIKYRTTQPIVYHLDKGGMGAFSNAVARNLAITSFQTWEDVGTATITFRQDSMSVDVTAANWSAYIGNYTDGLSPIIFDNDGSIIDAMLGEGQSASIIGFAGSGYATGGVNAGFYVEGHAVMNGTMAGTQFTEAQFKSTFVHEFGHFIGLDHSQVNAVFASDGNTANDQYLPTMYPTSSDDDVQLATLNVDDIVAVSLLYPVASFATSTGTISGTVTRQDNSVVSGAVVVAINIADSLASQYSTISDYLLQNTGSYDIAGLPPGTYWVKLEPVRSAFTGGSSVGPYADDPSGLSFVNPVLPEYYNGAGESWDPSIDTATSRVIVTVTAGAATTANFVSNGDAAPAGATVLENFGPETYVFDLPSEYDDQKYAVRFTPGMNALLQKVTFRLNGGAGAIKGTGTLKVTVHTHKTGSIGGIPDTQIGSAVTRPFSSLTSGVFNEVDLSPLNITVQPNVNFHIAFEVVGVAGDTLQFLSDDGVTAPTTRSSSWFDPGTGFQWRNFEDNNFGAGYNLMVRAYLTSSTGTGSDPVVLLPEGFALVQNYPNPFNPATAIPFRLSENGVVTLEVFDLLGRTVATVLDRREFSAGDHQVTFAANGLPSGTYVAAMSVGGRRQFIKMLLLR